MIDIEGWIKSHRKVRYIPYKITIDWRRPIYKHYFFKRTADKIIMDMVFSNTAGYYYHKDEIVIILENIIDSQDEYDDSIEELTCKIISHEHLHLLLNKEHGMLASKMLDNICTSGYSIGYSGIDED